MAMDKEKDFDSMEEFEPKKETANRLPVGWLVLYFGLIVWGLYYLAAYTPTFSGWTQSGAYEQSVKK